MKEPEEELTQGDKEWMELAKQNPWLFSNYGDGSKDEEDEDNCSETSFQKFCDYSGNNRYPTE